MMKVLMNLNKHIKIEMADQSVASDVLACYEKDQTETGQMIQDAIKKVCPQSEKKETEAKAFHQAGLIGVNRANQIIRKGSVDAMHDYFLALGHVFPDSFIKLEQRAKENGERVEVVSRNHQVIASIVY